VCAPATELDHDLQKLQAGSGVGGYGVPLRKLLAHGNDKNEGGIGHTELRSEKMSDAALGAQQAILKSFDKGG
jgi:hypothetical protein